MFRVFGQQRKISRITILHEAHGRQIEETMKTLAEGPEKFYEGPLE
jgi:hypothetical protein